MTPLTLRARSSSGPPIHDLVDWERYASTTGKWADGFSAKELARLWLTGTGHEHVQAALGEVIPGLQIELAIAEAQVSFDPYRGGVRNHDVLAYGPFDGGHAVVGVEGKVNESLDSRLKHKYAAAEKRKRDNNNTNLDRRVDGLLAAIIGKHYRDDPNLPNLRYQVFSAIAGTVAAAKPTTTAAAVVVHLIDTKQAKPKKFEQTRDAIADFARAAGLDGGRVVGPVHLKRPIGEAPLGLPIYLTVIETAPAAAGGHLQVP
jgi:hypothetical protein